MRTDDPFFTTLFHMQEEQIMEEVAVDFDGKVVFHNQTADDPRADHLYFW